MKTLSHSPASSVSVASTAAVPGAACFLGLDLGDRKHWVCVLDAAGTVVREGPMPNTRPALDALLRDFPRATVALEAGTHSPWISRHLQALGATVFVANPRKLQTITRHERKCDRRDAHTLARLVRADPALLHPVEHGTEQAQHDLLGLKLRDVLVRQRVGLINAVRFTLKSLGHAVRNPSSESFHRSVLAEIPATCLPVVRPLLIVLETITAQIRELGITQCLTRLNENTEARSERKARSSVEEGSLFFFVRSDCWRSRLFIHGFPANSFTFLPPVVTSSFHGNATRGPGTGRPVSVSV